MEHTVASRRAVPRNLAIITIAPLSGNVLDFNMVDEVLTEFFATRRIAISDIQPCYLV
jgi:hypothetical protein